MTREETRSAQGQTRGPRRVERRSSIEWEALPITNPWRLRDRNALHGLQCPSCDVSNTKDCSTVGRSSKERQLMVEGLSLFALLLTRYLMGDRADPEENRAR